MFVFVFVCTTAYTTSDPTEETSEFPCCFASNTPETETSTTKSQSKAHLVLQMMNTLLYSGAALLMLQVNSITVVIIFATYVITVIVTITLSITA